MSGKRGAIAAILVAYMPSLSTVTAIAEETAGPTAKGVQDNSFFLEEAYNQEAGVVQHIFNLATFRDDRGPADQRDLRFAFTQEWPLFGQTHQLSYTVPLSLVEEGGDSNGGVGDILLNYRLQALTESERRPAFAPRFSLIVPTGDEKQGLGTGTAGCQVNLPVSKIVSDRLTLHGNAGLTFFPDAEGHDLLSYNVGASAIWAVSRDFNFLLECVANFDQELADGGGTDRSSSVILSPGVRYALNFPDNLQIVLGIATPIGLTQDAPDFGLLFYFSVEHPFARQD